ncbi:hypothetical protein L21SP5_03466 [Salinivirga cyanobacteriivorans]|uniref:Uncharacterized protein n=1 Tax=Salinivirga cyanobacteriivorans TaxID=1307839 RepID=A0A0S2I4G5_9BACT|nr:hypothetical protein L21SP5_03466 [Salinivirga cyanobacteriivorans]
MFHVKMIDFDGNRIIFANESGVLTYFIKDYKVSY